MPGDDRAIGRILSLGFPMPGVRVDNYNFCSAPAFFDYDALVVEPRALAQLIEDTVAGTIEPVTFGDRPVRNEPHHADDVRLADLLLRRRDETRDLLARGGVVVCFGHPATVHEGIAGAEPLDDYWWLGEHAPRLVAGDGTQARVVDYQHALAPFVLSQLANTSYRAHVAPASSSGMRVFARSYGGAAIGAEYAAGAGHVVLLPALKAVPTGNDRYATSDALQAGIRRLLGVMAEGRAPAWAEQRDLPGIAEREAALQAARTAAEASAKALAEAEARHDELARYRRLLWQQGAVGLDDVVLDALRLLGFDVYASDPENVELRADGVQILLEIDASDGPVGLAPHYRLRQRIERAIERAGAVPRGLIVINGQRLTPPLERAQQASAELQAAAETMRYGVARATGLFDAVAAKLAGDDSAVAAYRLRLASEVGLVM